MRLFRKRAPLLPRQDFTGEAIALFQRFAARNGLRYEVKADAPIEVLWTFPAQENLTYPVVLGLQNEDELNFGVGEFWSYFFPYPEVAAEFEALLEAWAQGRARIDSVNGRRAIALQVLSDGEWRTRYRCPRERAMRGKPFTLISNRVWTRGD